MIVALLALLLSAHAGKAQFLAEKCSKWNTTLAKAQLFLKEAQAVVDKLGTVTKSRAEIKAAWNARKTAKKAMRKAFKAFKKAAKKEVGRKAYKKAIKGAKKALKAQNKVVRKARKARKKLPRTIWKSEMNPWLALRKTHTEAKAKRVALKAALMAKRKETAPQAFAVFEPKLTAFTAANDAYKTMKKTKKFNHRLRWLTKKTKKYTKKMKKCTPATTAAPATTPGVAPEPEGSEPDFGDGDY